MTSEPDSTPRRRPPTIDLTAKEVETEHPGSTPNSAAEDAGSGRGTAAEVPGGRRSTTFLARAIPYALGAALGAIAVVAIVAGFWFAGFAPLRAPAPSSVAPTAPAAPAPRTADTDDISSRLDKIQQALQAPRADDAVAGRIAAAETKTKSLGDELTALTRRIDEVGTAAQSALAQAKTAADGAEAAKSAAQNAAQAALPRGDADALNKRLAALESAVKSLAADLAQRTPSTDDRAARATIAAEALRVAVERGAPYQAELAAVQALGADQNATAPLLLFATDGIPSASALARDLSALTPALLQASGAEPNEGSLLGRLEAHAQQLVRITPLDAPAGKEPAAVVARLNVDAAHGDIAAALAEIDHLPQAARSVAEGWVKKAEAREQAIAASRRIAAAALAALGGPASQ